MGLQKMNLSGTAASNNTDSFILNDKHAEALRNIVEAGEGIPVNYVFNYNRMTRRVSICAEDEDAAETHIEFSEVNGEYILFDVVCLKNTRCGTFTKFMQYLSKTVSGTSIRYIEFQSVLTAEMRNWCAKYDFETIPGHTYDADGLGGGYRLSARAIRMLGAGVV